MFEPLVLGMYCNTSVTKHCLDTSRSNFNELGRVILERILEMNNNTKLDLLFMSRNLNEGPFLNIDMVDFNV